MRRLLKGVGAGAAVVLRGRESRPHGESHGKGGSERSKGGTVMSEDASVKHRRRAPYRVRGRALA